MSVTVTINGAAENIAVSDVAALLALRGIDAERVRAAVALNGRVVPRRAWRETAVKDGDEIEIVAPVGGG
jgi:sulfur carrier protein